MKVGIGIVGCGNVCGRYVEALRRLECAELLGVTDIRHDRAERCAQSFAGISYASVDELLADTRVQVVVNLTPPSQHATVTRQALQAGRHVYSEKPIASNAREALSLVDLASRQDRYLACAPSSVLGPSQQELLALLRSGELGKVRVAYAESDWGPSEYAATHPPELMAIGPTADVGIYPLALLISALGDVTSVRAVGANLMSEGRNTDHVIAILHHRSFAVSRLTCSFYVQHRPLGSSVTFHGDRGTARLDSWHGDNAAIQVGPRGGQLTTRPRTEPTTPPVNWARGVEELLAAVRDGREPRTGGVIAAHHVEVLQAIAQSIHTDREVRLSEHGDLPAIRL